VTLADATLQQLFGLDRPEAAAAIRAGLHEEKADEGLRKEAAKAPGVHQTALAETAADKLPDLLNVKVISILTGAWTKYELLKKYADRREYPPEETVLLPLAEHTVKSEHHPYVEILVNGRPVGKITFDVTVSLKLESFELKLQDGKIKAVNAGTVQGSGEISFYGVTLIKKEIEPVTVHASINLGDGIPLRKLAAAG
jgi:hypothetical protein